MQMHQWEEDRHLILGYSISFNVFWRFINLKHENQNPHLWVFPLAIAPRRGHDEAASAQDVRGDDAETGGSASRSDPVDVSLDLDA